METNAFEFRVDGGIFVPGGWIFEGHDYNLSIDIGCVME